MKFTHLRAWLVTTIISVCACKKEPSPQPPSPSTTEHQLSLSYAESSGSGSYELLVTDSLGRVLLDSTMAVNQMATVKFLSDQSAFNLTTIELWNQHYFVAKTYYQVNPSQQWNINQKFIKVHQPAAANLPQGPYIYYTNVPKVYPSPAPLSPYLPVYTGATSVDLNYYYSTLRTYYRKNDPYYSYIAFPSIRSYKFHKTVTNHDTVNLSSIDTGLLSVTYPLNFDATPYNVRELIGYTKKNDYSTYTRLWDEQYDYWKTYGDFMYPPGGVEQYLVRYTVFDKDSRIHYSQALSDKMPATLEFMDDSYISVVKKDINDFEINFPKAQPTVYALGLNSAGSDTLSWQILLPSNKTRLKGSNQIVDLKKSKLLSAFDFSAVKLTGVELTKADNYSYYDYLNIIFDPNAATSPQKVMNWMNYSTSKGF